MQNAGPGPISKIAQSQNRTDDLRITNALLYQLSYLGLTKL